MKMKQRINIEELGRHLLSRKELKENNIPLNEDTGAVISYCMNIFLEEIAKQNERKEKKEFAYLYNNFVEDLEDAVNEIHVRGEEEEDY